MTHTPETIAALLAGTTPGDWRTAGKASGYVVTENDPDTGYCLICVVGNFLDEELVPQNADRWNADARLIAAAPTLATELSAALVREKALREAYDCWARDQLESIYLIEAVGKFLAALEQEDQG